jgi:hypothetical protein
MDAALLGIVRGALEPYGGDAATLEHAWSEAAGMWLIRVAPRNAGAAAFSAGFDGEDLVSIMVGNTWFEVFPARTVADLTPIQEIARAVFGGHVQEARVGGGFARIALADGRVVEAGRVHAPIPWKLRHARRYTAYTRRPGR